MDDNEKLLIVLLGFQNGLISSIQSIDSLDLQDTNFASHLAEACGWDPELSHGLASLGNAYAKHCKDDIQLAMERLNGLDPLIKELQVANIDSPLSRRLLETLESLRHSLDPEFTETLLVPLKSSIDEEDSRSDFHHQYNSSWIIRIFMEHI